MAYFSNGTEGMVFDDQCGRCKYGEHPCPIALVQINYNYDAANNKVASDILNSLVKDDGTCEMYETFKQDLAIDPNQTKSFLNNLNPQIKNEQFVNYRKVYRGR
jgi:hypothetical protein